MRRDVIAHRQVPRETVGEMKRYLEADTHGHWNALWLMYGMHERWGLKSSDNGKGFEANFDLDGDGVIGEGDWRIAKQAWYEQHPSAPPVNY